MVDDIEIAAATIASVARLGRPVGGMDKAEKKGIESPDPKMGGNHEMSNSYLMKRRPRQNIISMILAKASSSVASVSVSTRSSSMRQSGVSVGAASSGGVSKKKGSSSEILRSAVELTRRSQKKLASSATKSRSKSGGRKGKAGSGHFAKGQRAFYRSAKGITKVTIVGVHHDSKLVPYYTIQLRDGKEKQSDAKHLTPCEDVVVVERGGGGGNSIGNRKSDSSHRSLSKSSRSSSKVEPSRQEEDHGDSLTDEHMTESSSEGEVAGRSKKLDNDDDEPRAEEAAGGGGGVGGHQEISPPQGNEDGDDGGEVGGGTDGEGTAKKFHVGEYAYYRPPDCESVSKVRIVRHSKAKDRYAVLLPDGSHQENVKPCHLRTLMELSSNEMISLMKEGNKQQPHRERSSSKGGGGGDRLGNFCRRSTKSDEGCDEAELDQGEEEPPISSGSENSRSPHRASTDKAHAALLSAFEAVSPPPAVRMVQAKTEDGNWRTVPLYEAGMFANYTNANGTQGCTVLTVHLDDLMEPYYTVRLQDGKEKQTDNAHISLRSVEEDANTGGGQGGEKNTTKDDTEGGEASPDKAKVSKRSSSTNRPEVTQKEERVDPSAVESMASLTTFVSASFFKGDQVLYNSSEGGCLRAVVVKLQRDKKNRPYYVVRVLATGKEKLVYGHRLQPIAPEDHIKSRSRSKTRSRSKRRSSDGDGGSSGGQSESGSERGRSVPANVSKEPAIDNNRGRGGSRRPNLERSESIDSRRSKRSQSRESTHTTLSNSSRRSQHRNEQKNIIARDDSKAPSSSVRRDPSATRDGRRERKESSITRDQQQANNDPVRTSRSRSSSVRRFLSSSSAEPRRNRESSRSRTPSEDSRRSAPSSTSSDRADGKHSSRRGTSMSHRGSVPTVSKSVKKTPSSGNGRGGEGEDDSTSSTSTPATAISKLKSFRKSFALMSKSAK